MAVSEDTRARLLRWCAQRVPPSDRGERQIGYTIRGSDITLVDRRPPRYPELGAAWTSTPIVRLRADDPRPGEWTLYRPSGEGDWVRTDSSGDDPVALLDLVTV